MSSFTDALVLKVHTGTLAERPFELLEAFRDWSTIGASEAEPRWISVPAGYRTDFASIPRLVWPLLPPVGRTGKAAVIFFSPPGAFSLSSDMGQLRRRMHILSPYPQNGASPDCSTNASGTASASLICLPSLTG